jgi:hypothetical protein
MMVNDLILGLGTVVRVTPSVYYVAEAREYRLRDNNPDFVWCIERPRQSLKPIVDFLFEC